MKYLPLGRFAPDQPNLRSGVSHKVSNVVPLTKGQGVTYGPLKKLTDYSNALDTRCQGAYSFYGTDGEIEIFAGSSDKLYHLNNTTDPNFVDISQAATTYTIPEDDFWDFTNFGDRVIAVNFNDSPQSFVVGTDSEFSDLDANAPRAKTVSVVKEWTVLGHTVDGTDGEQPQRIWWSGIGDPTSWPTPGGTTAISQQSDYQNLAGDLGAVQTIIPEIGNSDAIIFAERGIHTMNYVGPPSIFAFRSTEGARGTPAPKSVVKVGNVCYYLGEDGFYRFDGSTSTPIGAQLVDETFFSEVASNYIGRIVGAADPARKLVYWIYPASQNENGTPEKMLIYNWHIQEWSTADVVNDFIFSTDSFDMSLEDFDSIYASVEDIPASLDSPLWTSTVRLIAGFKSNFKMGFFTGNNMSATIDLPEIYPLSNRKSNILMSRPHIKGFCDAQVAIGTRECESDQIVFTSYVSKNADEEHPHRTSGRYFTPRIRIPADEEWQQIYGLELLTKTSGRR